MRACRARVVMEVRDSEHLVTALEPDNVTAPGHVRVRCEARGRQVECSVEVDGCEDPKRVLTLRNTLDEVITLARTVEEVLNAVDEPENTL